VVGYVVADVQAVGTAVCKISAIIEINLDGGLLFRYLLNCEKE